MTSLKGLYDPSDKADSGLAVLPAGPYTVKVTGGEMKRTKRGDGEYLQVEMTVVEGEYQGSVIFDRFNLSNPSQEAVRIARSQFAALREAVGILEPNDIADLMGIRFQLVLKCEKRNDDPTKMSNVVQRYIKKGQTAATPQQRQEEAPYARNAPRQAPPANPPGSDVATGAGDDDSRPPW